MHTKAGDNIVPGDNHLTDPIQHLITTRDPKIHTKVSDNNVHLDNPSSDPIQLSITNEDRESQTKKSRDNVVPGSNPSYNLVQHTITSEDRKPNNRQRSSNNDLGISHLNNFIQHTVTAEDRNSHRTQPGKCMVSGDNPSADRVENVSTTEVQKIYISSRDDILPGDSSFIDSTKHLVTTEDPKTYTNTSHTVVPAENLSKDPRQQLLNTDYPSIHHTKKDDDILPTENLSTDSIQRLTNIEDSNTHHAKTTDVSHQGNRSIETGTPSETNAVSLVSRDIHDEKIQLNGTSMSVRTPLGKNTRYFSRLTCNHQRHETRHTPAGFDGSRKLQSKHLAVKNHTRLCLNKRTYTLVGPITKTELELALPRKSFFNCHEKALKEAGYEVYTNATDITDTTKLNTDQSTLPTETFSSLQPTDSPNDAIQSNIKIVITDVSVNEMSKIDKADRVENTGELNENATLKVPEVDKTSAKASDPTKLQFNAMKNKRPETATVEYFESKPLRKYLEYVKENQHEYLQFQRSSRINTLEQPVSSSLLKLGHAFELRNHGGKMRPRDEPLVVASRALRPRTADFGKFSKYRDGDSWISEQTSSLVKQQNRHNLDKSTQGMIALPSLTSEMNPKSELEKLKQKAEEWCKSVPTNTVVKAKLCSLKELGTEDFEVTNWSEAFQNCSYIRQIRL